jgi:hypothetical protein
MIRTLTKSVFYFLAFLTPFTIFAQTVVISEVGFRSTASVDDYVELYNNTGSAINLGGYTLVPSTGSTVTLTGTIPANGFYVIGKNTTEAAFETSWGVTFGATSVYENSGTVLSTTSGVTFTLRNSGGVDLDNTTGYGITLGTRLYQCPVGSFAGNDQVETTTSSCSPGGINSLSVDDLTHWGVSIYNLSWDVSFINHATFGRNLIIKNNYWSPGTTDQVNDVYVVQGSYINISSANPTIAGNLYMENTSTLYETGTGSLSVSGTIYYKAVGNTSNAIFNLWTSPLSDSPGLLSTFTDANPCDIYTYQATTQEWKADYFAPFTTTCLGNSVTFENINVLAATDGTADGNMDLGRGYFIPGSGAINATKTFTGNSFNSGDINTVEIFGSSAAVAGGNDWNLIGNPYPSGLWVNRFLQNVNNSGLFNALYVYNGATGAYETYNQVSGFILAPAQGFFVNATSTTDGLLGTVNYSNSMRCSCGSTFRNDFQTIYLALNHQNLTDQLQVILDANSSDNIDNVHDAFKLPNPNNLNFASKVDAELLVFNGIKPVNQSETKTVELFIQTPAAGSYEINLDSLNLIDNYMDIKLEDRLNSTFTDLRAGSFTFTTASGDSLTNRFFLHLTNNITSVSEALSTLKTSIYTDQENINITIIGNENIKNVNIFDVTGRMVQSLMGTSNSMKVNTKSFNQGVYIVKLITETGNMATQRVLIK